MGISNNQIKIIAINVNSIVTNERKHSLLKFIENHDLDLMLLSETKLNKKHVVTFANYDIIRNYRLNAIQGCGTAILIRKKIDYSIPNLQSKKTFEQIECTDISIKLSNKQS